MNAVFVLTTMIVCSSLLTTMAAVTLFPDMMATPFPIHSNNNDCPLFCTESEMHKPICASNGTANISYENDCFMKVLNCRYNANFTKLHDGLCKTSFNEISEMTEDVSPTPDNSFHATTTGTDVPSYHTFSYGLSANNSSSTNSYEVYENVEELPKGSNSTPDTTVTSYTSTESLKALENSNAMNSTTGTSSSMTTQEFSNFEGDGVTTPTPPIIKEMDNSTNSDKLGFEATTKYFENGSQLTSKTVLLQSSSTSLSLDHLKSDTTAQLTTVNPTENVTVESK